MNHENTQPTTTETNGELVEFILEDWSAALAKSLGERAVLSQRFNGRPSFSDVELNVGVPADSADYFFPPTQKSIPPIDDFRE